MVILNFRKTLKNPDYIECLYCNCSCVKNPWPNTVIERVICEKCGEWNQIEWITEKGELARNIVRPTSMRPRSGGQENS
jgi:hypothetical protein